MTPDKATVELAPCPFCGSPATMRTTSASDSYVECLDVGCCKQVGLYQQPKYAAEDWNTRALPTPTDASGLVEALELTLVALRINCMRGVKGYSHEAFDKHEVVLKARQALANHRAGKHEDLPHDVSKFIDDNFDKLNGGTEINELHRKREGKQWSDEVPTVPGWYWWRKDRRRKGEQVYVHHIAGAANGLYVRRVGKFDSDPLRTVKGQWYGPLQPPADKEGKG